MAEVEVDAAVYALAARVAAARGERVEDVVARMLVDYVHDGTCPPNGGQDHPA